MTTIPGADAGAIPFILGEDGFDLLQHKFNTFGAFVAVPPSPSDARKLGLSPIVRTPSRAARWELPSIKDAVEALLAKERKNPRGSNKGVRDYEKAMPLIELFKQFEEEGIVKLTPSPIEGKGVWPYSKIVWTAGSVERTKE
eukprot:2520522-Rhodomonas_salina.1